MEKINKEDIAHIYKVMEGFKKEKTEKEIFYNFCFAILVPQTTHKKTLTVISELKQRNFFDNDLSEDELKQIVKPTRFYNNKTRYLISLKQNWGIYYAYLKYVYVGEQRLSTTYKIRKFLVDNVKGIGMKAASHLLRNLGCEYVAIIDTHILKHYGFSAPKDECDYYLLEGLLQQDAANHGMSVGMWDIYLWKIYSNTDWKNFIY